MKSLPLSYSLQSKLQQRWRWIFVILLSGLMAVISMAFYTEDRSDEDEFNPEKQVQFRPSNSTLPDIKVMRILASPFNSQLEARLLLDGFEQRVHQGQKLREDLLVKSIDIHGVDILFHQQLRRYDVTGSSDSAKKIVRDKNQESMPVPASIDLLSHQFRSTPEGLEVYSVTQQGLSASLGLQNGDRVSKINGASVNHPEDISRILKNYHPQQLLEFEGSRKGQTTTWVYQAQADD